MRFFSFLRKGIGFVLLFTFAQTNAQFTVSTGIPPEKLVEEILPGPGIQIRNVKFDGAAEALGKFDNPSAKPHFEGGIIISTGLAKDAEGPNNTTSKSNINHTHGNTLLKRLHQGASYDAAILEFDFQAAKDSVFFNFCFASEEWNEYVGTNYDDVFAIFLSGPGYMSGHNLATVPGTEDPININTVNGIKNSRYFVDNNPWSKAGTLVEHKLEKLDPEIHQNFQYDGFTTIISAQARVKPSTTYHIRIIIADIDDEKHDSAILLQGGSFQSIEQHRWAVRRAQIEAARIQDSIATAIRIADSLANIQRIADSIALANRPVDSLGNYIDSVQSPENDAQSPENEDFFSPGEDEDLRNDEIDTRPEDRPSAPIPPPTQPKAIKSSTLSPLLPGPADSLEYKLVLSFEDESFILNPDHYKLLDAVVDWMNKYPTMKAGIYGHQQKDELVSKLGELRANRAMIYLAEHGVSARRLFINGFSFSSSRDEKKQPERRVEIWLKREP